MPQICQHKKKLNALAIGETKKYEIKIPESSFKASMGEMDQDAPILTYQVLDPIVHSLSISVFKQSDQDLDQSRWGILIYLAHA